MAILQNILRGQLTGRLGNNYFQVAKSKTGRPVSKLSTINANPTNPKTDTQQTQRGKFANAVKFYRHATSNFFRFAFEDKKPNESDYNAFMRNNIDKSLFLPKDYVNSPIFPALGDKWMLSKGSLAFGLSHGFDTTSTETFYALNIENDGTVQDLSASLIKKYNLKVGDIITFVFIQSQVTSFSLSNIDTLPAPLWQIFQMKVTVSGYSLLRDMQSIGSQIVYIDKDTSGLLFYQEAPIYSLWGGMVITRKSSKLLAQTAYLEPNYYASQLIAAARASTVIDEALSSWQAEDLAILQGSVADNATSDASDTDFSDVTITRIDNTTTGKYSTSSEYLLGSMQKSSYVIKVTGTNLPEVAPTSSNTLRCTISKFTHTSDTEVSFTLNRGTQAGSFTINLWGKAVIDGAVPSSSDSDAGVAQEGDGSND